MYKSVSTPATRHVKESADKAARARNPGDLLEVYTRQHFEEGVGVEHECMISNRTGNADGNSSFRTTRLIVRKYMHVDGEIDEVAQHCLS